MMFVMFLLAAIVTACQGPPPTQIILVVTATPTPIPNDAEETAEVSPTAETAVTKIVTGTPSRATATPGPTETPDLFPTNTVNQIQVAEQVFENGRMFWFQPTEQIWVMIVTGEGEGDWRIYEDTFVEGELESDPDIEPPDGLEQPTRGFGKLWRENPDVREALGWAVTPEFGFVTRYEYHPGGEVEDGEWVQEPGYHVISSLYEEAFRFNEADQTWQLN
jgi:hypothetical protein